MELTRSTTHKDHHRDNVMREFTYMDGLLITLVIVIGAVWIYRILRKKG
jgi:cytochrome c biogenesis factor